MSEPLDRDRRVLPRWHSPADAARRIESQALAERRPARRSLTVDLRQLVGDWQRHEHHVFASDLVSAALPFGEVPEVRDAAEYLLQSADSSPLAKMIARRYLARRSVGQLALTRPEGALDLNQIKSRIRQLRIEAGRQPDNVLLWVERARQYVLAGQAEPAKKAMRVALALAPNSRGILRSACRLWVHVGDPVEAHRVLLRAPRTPEDPWLISAEIAVASIAGQGPRFVGAGRAMLTGGMSQAHLTELAASLATLELENGNDRQARKLFGASLREPNENALAQAEWASPSIHVPNLSEQFDRVPESWEARALSAAAEDDLQMAIREASLWLADQPYSTEAAVFGSYHASKIEAYPEAIGFAELGLVANPRHALLLNNLAFCFAKSDRLEDAEDAIARIPRNDIGSLDPGTLKATQGLIAFRRGDHDEGLRLYTAAMEATANQDRKAIAFVMLASELMRTRPQESEEIARLAAARVADVPDSDARSWLGHLPAGKRVTLVIPPPRVSD